MIGRVLLAGCLAAGASQAQSQDADAQGNTALHKACMQNKLADAQSLIEQGAKVNARNQWGHTPLHNAFGVNGPDVNLVKLLLAKGADVNIRGTRGEAPLHWAAGRGDVAATKLLIDAGADLNARDSSFGTPLHQALQQGKVEMAKLLVASGAGLKEKDPYEYTALHLAAIRGSAEMVHVLLKRGADVQATDRYGRTALYYAARHGWRAAANVLTAAGAREKTVENALNVSAPVAKGEARLWFLGYFAHDGYAVQTATHLLLFDPPGIDLSAEASLANGYLNPKELAGQRVTVFITKPKWERFELRALELAKHLEGVNVVMPFQPEGRTMPPYRLAAAGESFTVGDVRVRTIKATLGGAGYLVEADGLKIFHAGYHSRNTPAQDEAFRREVEWLRDSAPVDVAMLPVAGHLVAPYTYEAYADLVARLRVRAVYLMHGAYGRQAYWECATLLQRRGARVEFPENEGDHFRFDGTPPLLDENGKPVMR